MLIAGVGVFEAGTLSELPPAVQLSLESLVFLFAFHLCPFSACKELVTPADLPSNGRTTLDRDLWKGFCCSACVELDKLPSFRRRLLSAASSPRGDRTALEAGGVGNLTSEELEKNFKASRTEARRLASVVRMRDKRAPSPMERLKRVIERANPAVCHPEYSLVVRCVQSRCTVRGCLLAGGHIAHPAWAPSAHNVQGHNW